jgi:hypothetical protein
VAGNTRAPEPDAAPVKQHVAIRQFRQYDPQTGKPKTYVGSGDELYTGPLGLPYLLDPAGPDGKGPLIAEKSDVVKPAPPAASGDSSTKEK